VLAALRKIDGAIAAVEKLLVVTAIAAMVLLSATQIGMRTVGAGGLPWADELIRFSMMWVAFLGASLATMERRHITIDLLDRSLSPRSKAAFNLVVEILGVLVIGAIAYVGFWYIDQERAYPDKSPALGVLYWHVKTIIPAALGIIAWRFGLLAIEDARALRIGDFKYLDGPDTEGRLY
jgi:TRAP-type C4-dicarboxylate transport system permease small subunit